MEADYRDYLQQVLADRQAGNPAYSLRAFARDLGVNPATLSQALNRKRRVSPRNAEKIAVSLHLSPAERARLFTPSTTRRVGQREAAEYLTLDEDRFRLVADWYYFAILSLARLRKNRGTPDWIAKRLGISVTEARTAVARLKRLGLVATRGGRLLRTSLPLMTDHALGSAALRRHQKQNLKLAELAIDRDPITRRENSSVTMAIDPRRIAEAKRRILKFKEKLSNYLGEGEPSEVYTMAIHLFPAYNGKDTP